MADHVHTKVFSVNNTLVCGECITEEQKGQNECFCQCHLYMKGECLQCSKFHR